MIIQFGTKPTADEKWEVYSDTNMVAIGKRFWRTLGCAEAYAKTLRLKHNDVFKVRWCQPEPIKPVKQIGFRMKNKIKPDLPVFEQLKAMNTSPQPCKHTADQILEKIKEYHRKKKVDF